MAVIVWSEEAGAYITPEDILVRGEDGVYYSVPQINVVGTDGVWEQVWPERLYLYRPGDECVSVTGGWIGGSGGTLGATSDNGVLNTATTKIAETSRIGFANNNPSNSYMSVKFLRTDKKIDITRYNKLVSKILYTGRDTTLNNTGTYHGFGLSAGDFNSKLFCEASRRNYNAPDVVSELTVNLSDRTGKYYMVVFSQHVRNTSNTSYLYLYEAYLTV